MMKNRESSHQVLNSDSRLLLVWFLGQIIKTSVFSEFCKKLFVIVLKSSLSAISLYLSHVNPSLLTEINYTCGKQCKKQ